MSIKIYTGYRLAAGTDLFSFLARVRAVLDPVRDRLDAGRVTAEALRLIDEADVTGQPRPTRPFATAAAAYQRDQRQMRDVERGQDPHRFEVALFDDSATAGGTGRILALVFTDEQDAYLPVWETFGEVERYGYWSSSDRPEAIDERAWADRRDAWARVWPDHRPAAEHALTFSLRSSRYDTGISRLSRAVTAGEEQALALVDAAAPGLRERAWNIAADRAVRYAVDHLDMAPVTAAARCFGEFRTVTTVALGCLDPAPASTLVTAADPVTRPVPPEALAAVDAAVVAYFTARETVEH